MKTFKAIRKSNGKKYVLFPEIRTVITGVDLVSPDDLVQPGEIYYRGWLENSKNGQTYDFHPDEFGTVETATIDKESLLAEVRENYKNARRNHQNSRGREKNESIAILVKASDLLNETEFLFGLPVRFDFNRNSHSAPVIAGYEIENGIDGIKAELEKQQGLVADAKRSRIRVTNREARI
jgi:hypothetical protein